MRGLGICPAPDTFGKERRPKIYVAQALNRQKHQTSHPKHPRFAQIHTDTPLFSPTSENPATKDEVIEALNAIEVFDICIAVILWDWDRYFEGR